MNTMTTPKAAILPSPQQPMIYSTTNQQTTIHHQKMRQMPLATISSPTSGRKTMALLSKTTKMPAFQQQQQVPLFLTLPIKRLDERWPRRVRITPRFVHFYSEAQHKFYFGIPFGIQKKFYGTERIGDYSGSPLHPFRRFYKFSHKTGFQNSGLIN